MAGTHVSYHDKARQSLQRKLRDLGKIDTKKHRDVSGVLTYISAGLAPPAPAVADEEDGVIGEMCESPMRNKNSGRFSFRFGAEFEEMSEKAVIDKVISGLTVQEVI